LRRARRLHPCVAEIDDDERRGGEDVEHLVDVPHPRQVIGERQDEEYA
jgi:hypothetical protein